MAGLPNNVSNSVKKLNPHLFHGAGAPTEPLRKVAAVVKERNIIRVTKSAEEKLNKTERRFLESLRRLSPPEWRIGIQDITLRLAADCRYTPDFSASDGVKLYFYEVKGPFTWDDAKVKLKTAAALFPMFKFCLAYEVDGEWKIQEIPR